MKLTKDDIGKKFTHKDWGNDQFIILFGITSRGHVVGENQNGFAWESISSDNFIPYEEPKQKKRIESAPGVIKLGLTKQKYFISHAMYSSFEEAIKDNFEIVHWPASWDPIKGVWFYEYEE